MAVRTFTSAGVNNLWSNAANWDGGASIPANNDVVIIPALQTCEFDVDQSGFANGIDGLTITGTLKLTRTAGTYYLKIKAGKTINGAGTFDCGTSALDAIPFTARHTNTGGTAWFIDGSGGLSMTVYAAEPSIKYVSLTATKSAGTTVLPIDTDVTGDIWQPGDIVAISEYGTYETIEYRTIAAGGITSNSITITAGLSAEKLINAKIALVTRNVKFIGAGASGWVAKNFSSSGKVYIAGGAWSTANYRIFSACNYMNISGGSFYNAQYGFLSCTNLNISGGVFTTAYVASLPNYSVISGGYFIGCAYVMVSGIGILFTGGYVTGGQTLMSALSISDISGITAEGNANVLSECNGINMNDVIIRDGIIGIYKSSVIINNSSFSNMLTSDIQTSKVTAFNTLFGSSLEYSLYSAVSRMTYSESINHDKVAGAYKAWTSGGITSSQTSVLPAGYAKGYITILENASVEGYWQREITVGAGASVNITMNLRKDASMAYLPRAIIFNKASTDPFAGGAGLHTFTMTNSVNAWESDLYTYTNSGTEDVTLVVRIQGMNATGNMYSALDVEQINVDLTTALAKIDVIDGLVDAIKLKTDNLPASPADQSELEVLIAALSPAPSASDIIAALKVAVFDGTLTFEDSIKLYNAILFGKLDGGGSGTLKFRDPADTKDRVTATVDISTGDRDDITLDLT